MNYIYPVVFAMLVSGIFISMFFIRIVEPEIDKQTFVYYDINHPSVDRNFYYIERKDYNIYISREQCSFISQDENWIIYNCENQKVKKE